MILKILKRVLIAIVSLVILFTLAVIIFINTAPQMGEAPKGEHLEIISQSANYGEEGFENNIYTSMAMDTGSMSELFYEWMFNNDSYSPPKPLPTSFSEIKTEEDTTSWAVWYGHSTILLKMETTRILIDPVFGPAASPIPIFSKRFKNSPSFGIEDIPQTDIVLISHDHYDHLDYPTIVELAKQNAIFLVPLGVGSHLQRWGVEKERIFEMDWWESKETHGITFHAAPARHFSGRSLNDRSSTLWASWVLMGKTTKIYFSGDGGYSPSFKEIGDRFGPFDLCFIECGQYNFRWKDIHLTPEQTVQANIDLQGKTMIPIHWGAFNLAPHTWIDPAERVTVEANKKGVDLLTPLIGERILVNYPTKKDRWWRKIMN